MTSYPFHSKTLTALLACLACSVIVHAKDPNDTLGNASVPAITDSARLHSNLTAAEGGSRDSKFPVTDGVTNIQPYLAYDTSIVPDITPEWEFKMITKIDDLWTGERDENINQKLRLAQVAARSDDYANAEILFLEALNKPLTSEERYLGLLQMAAMYQEAGNYIKNESASARHARNAAFLSALGDRSLIRDNLVGSVSNIVKAISVYEKFVSLYQHDALAPVVNLQLGRLYRQIGVTELALNRFYDTINTSIDISPANIPAYRKLTRKAKKEIANTYFLSGSFKQALDYLLRLELLNMGNDDRQEVLFKIAYSRYMQLQHDRARAAFEKFLMEFPESILAPESYYILSKTFHVMDQPQKAVDQMLKLLGHQHVKDPQDDEIWKYWQKRAGNELANQFYDERDWRSALKLYQAMFKLDTSPHWRYPMLYQIGLTLEHFDEVEKALETYAKITEGTLWDENTEKESFDKYSTQELSEDLLTIQQLADWHAAKLEWNISIENKLQRLLLADESGS